LAKTGDFEMAIDMKSRSNQIEVTKLRTVKVRPLRESALEML